MRPEDETIEELREKLIDYYGSATAVSPMAAADLIRVETMSDEEIIAEAEKNRIR